MYPTLLSIGPLSLSSFWLFLIIAWLVFSFLFWRELRNQAITEEHIYHLMFYGTLAAFVGSRLGFIVFHGALFEGSFWIRIFTLWIQPGLSFYGALLAGGAVMLGMSRSYAIRRSLFLDAFTIAFSSAFPWIALAGFLEGSSLGKATNFVLGIRMNNHVGLIHPVALYEMFAVFIILLVLFLIRKFRLSSMERSGVYALWFFFLFSFLMFSLEFMKESPVYFSGLNINQWICVGIFGEAVGGIITWGGGKERIKLISRLLYKQGLLIGGALYAKFSRRNTQ